jgi:gas vesicle protein
MGKSNKFFLATMLGAVAGAIGGVLLAPKSGKETREDLKKLAVKLKKEVEETVKDTKERVKDVFGKASDEAMAKYNKIKSAAVNKVAELKTAGKSIDKDLYAKIVKEVVDDFKDDFKGTKDGANKMVNQLKKDWIKVKKVLV